MKELILINRYHQTQERPKPPVEQRVKVMNTLDKKMQTILNREDLSTDERLKLYDQLFTRYLNVYDDNRPRPVAVAPEPVKQDFVDDEILESVPKTMKAKAQLERERGTKIQGRNRLRKQRGGFSQQRAAQKEIFQPTMMGNIRRGHTRSKCSTRFDLSRGPLEIHHSDEKNTEIQYHHSWYNVKNKEAWLKVHFYKESELQKHLVLLPDG